MKKIASIFCATAALVLTSAADQGQPAADKKASIEIEMRAVEAKIAYMEDKQRQNVKIDESMLDGLRDQLSDLRRQLRHIRRDELVAQVANPKAAKDNRSSKLVSKKPSRAETPPRVRTRAERAAAQAERQEDSAKAGSSQMQDKSRLSESAESEGSVEPIRSKAAPKKRDSIWDHMFPF